MCPKIKPDYNLEHVKIKAQTLSSSSRTTNGKKKHFSHQIFFHGNFPEEEKSWDGAAYGNSTDDEFLMLSEKNAHMQLGKM